MRVAGGWAKDKLLGRDSDDIDITLDDMTGHSFCDKILLYYNHLRDNDQLLQQQHRCSDELNGITP